MRKREFKMVIDAPKETVWEVLWSNESYPKWTVAFAEGSHVETNWKEGSEIKFLGPNGIGIWSRIKVCRPSDTICFQHEGVIKDGKKIVDSAEAKQWIGIRENYKLNAVADKTEVIVETDIPDGCFQSFVKAFPQALQEVKRMSEMKN